MNSNYVPSVIADHGLETLLYKRDNPPFLHRNLTRKAEPSKGADLFHKRPSGTDRGQLEHWGLEPVNISKCTHSDSISSTEPTLELDVKGVVEKLDRQITNQSRRQLFRYQCQVELIFYKDSESRLGSKTSLYHDSRQATIQGFEEDCHHKARFFCNIQLQSRFSVPRSKLLQKKFNGLAWEKTLHEPNTAAIVISCSNSKEHGDLVKHLFPDKTKSANGALAVYAGALDVYAHGHVLPSKATLDSLWRLSLGPGTCSESLSPYGLDLFFQYRTFSELSIHIPQNKQLQTPSISSPEPSPPLPDKPIQVRYDLISAHPRNNAETMSPIVLTSFRCPFNCRAIEHKSMDQLKYHFDTAVCHRHLKFVVENEQSTPDGRRVFVIKVNLRSWDEPKKGQAGASRRTIDMPSELSQGNENPSTTKTTSQDEAKSPIESMHNETQPTILSLESSSSSQDDTPINADGLDIMDVDYGTAVEQVASPPSQTRTMAKPEQVANSPEKKIEQPTTRPSIQQTVQAEEDLPIPSISSANVPQENSHHALSIPTTHPSRSQESGDSTSMIGSSIEDVRRSIELPIPRHDVKLTIPSKGVVDVATIQEEIKNLVAASAARGHHDTSYNDQEEIVESEAASQYTPRGTDRADTTRPKFSTYQASPPPRQPPQSENYSKTSPERPAPATSKDLPEVVTGMKKVIPETPQSEGPSLLTDSILVDLKAPVSPTRQVESETKSPTRSLSRAPSNARERYPLTELGSVKQHFPPCAPSPSKTLKSASKSPSTSPAKRQRLAPMQQATITIPQYTPIPFPPLRVRRKHVVPAAPPGLSFFRRVSMRPLTKGELLSESDDDIDTSWIIQRHRDALTFDPSPELTPARRAFYQRFDAHFEAEGAVTRHAAFSGKSLIRFAQKNARWLKRTPGLIAEFILEAGIMVRDGVVKEVDIGKCLNIIRTATDERGDEEGETEMTTEEKQRAVWEKSWIGKCPCGKPVDEAQLRSAVTCASPVSSGRRRRQAERC